MIKMPNWNRSSFQPNSIPEKPLTGYNFSNSIPKCHGQFLFCGSNRKLINNQRTQILESNTGSYLNIWLLSHFVDDVVFNSTTRKPTTPNIISKNLVHRLQTSCPRNSYSVCQPCRPDFVLLRWYEREWIITFSRLIEMKFPLNTKNVCKHSGHRIVGRNLCPTAPIQPPSLFVGIQRSSRWGGDVDDRILWLINCTDATADRANE